MIVYLSPYLAVLATVFMAVVRMRLALARSKSSEIDNCLSCCAKFHGPDGEFYSWIDGQFVGEKFVFWSTDNSLITFEKDYLKDDEYYYVSIHTFSNTPSERNS